MSSAIEMRTGKGEFMRMIIASTAEVGHLLLFVIMINDTMHASIYSDVALMMERNVRKCQS